MYMPKLPDGWTYVLTVRRDDGTQAVIDPTGGGASLVRTLGGKDHQQRFESDDLAVRAAAAWAFMIEAAEKAEKAAKEASQGLLDDITPKDPPSRSAAKAVAKPAPAKRASPAKAGVSDAALTTEPVGA